MKQITDIENIIKLLTEEPDMVPNPPGFEDEVPTTELTDLQKLMGIVKGKFDADVFEDDYQNNNETVVYEVDDELIYVDLKLGEQEAAEIFQMEDWDFDIVRDFVQNNYDPSYYDPFACDSADEEWNEGYAASALNDENKKLLEKYFSYVSPVLSKDITKVLMNGAGDRGEDWSEVSSRMQDNIMGNRLVDDLLTDYCYAINPAMVNATAKDIREEWENQLKKRGATGWFDTDEITEFTIPIKEMIYTYYKQNRQKNGDTLEDMITYVVEDIGSVFGSLNDWWWESDYYEEFTTEYNSSATYTINRAIERIEDEDSQKLNKIQEISDKLSGIGVTMGEPIKLKGAPYEITIMELDSDDLKLRVRVRPIRTNSDSYNWGTYKIIKMDIDDLLKKFNNPELTSADDKQEYMSVKYNEQVQRLNENKLTETDRDVEINKFVGFCKDELDINELPPVTLRYDKKGGDKNSNIDTTAYQSKDEGVHVYVKDRALVDVLRSLAHELVHHHQLERDEEYYWKHIQDNPGIQSGTDLEDEANARAGSLIKDWGLVHGNKQIYESRGEQQVINEPLDEDLTNWAYDGEKIGPIEEDDSLNDLVYIEKPKEKHIKRMEKDWGELTGFPLEKFKNILPPENESDETEKELEHLDSILVDDSFVESADDVDQHFKNYLDSKDLDYPLQLIKKYMAGVRSIILKLKYHYNRPRPGQVADAIGMDFNPNSLKSASTPSYPSGHATQGRFIARLLGDVYPEHEEQLMKIGDDIALSRNMAKVHYPSDTKFGQKLGEELYNHISKNTTRPNLNEGRDFESFTKAEVKVMNTIANRFTYDELKEIADNGEFSKNKTAKRYLNLVKLFGVNDDSKAQAMDYGRIWAKWIVDNWDNHEGTVDSPDFTPLIGTEGVGKAYLDEYEVEGEEDVWEKAYRQGSVYMYGFDDDSMEDYANDYFYDYDPDMETVDWGDSDREDFRIGNVNRLGNSLRLNEQSIDISEIPAEDLSPELEVGDRVYGWDLRDDTLESDMVYPDQVIGNVVSVEEDELASNINWSRSIFYDIETIKGENVVLYPGDKYIKLPKKQLNEEEGTSEDLEAQVFRFIRPIDIEKALSQKEIQKVLKSLGLKYDMFDTLNIDLESDMVEDLRNQIRFDNFYKRMMAASDIRGGTWEGLFAGLFNGKVVAGDSGVGKADVMTTEGGWSLKFVGNKNESPTLGSLKTQLQKVKEEGLVPEDATIYGIFSTPDNQTSSELFEAKHQILDSAFQGVDFIAVAYPIPQQNTIIMHFTDMDNLKTMIIDSENPPINKPKSGPEALGELRLSSKGWKSLPFLQITFPEATQEKYETYLKKYPREKEIEGVFGKYGEKIPPEVLQYLRKNPKSVINRLQNIPGYDKYFTEEFVSSSKYLTQSANERLKSFKQFITEKCNIKDIPTTIGFRPREAWEDGLKDIFGRCWFNKTPKGVEGAFGDLADKTINSFLPEEYPEVVEIIGEIYEISEQIYEYLFPVQGEELKYSLRNVHQDNAVEILYNDVKELIERSEEIGNMVDESTEEEYLDDLEEIVNRIGLILQIFTSSVGSPIKKSIGFRSRG